MQILMQLQQNLTKHTKTGSIANSDTYNKIKNKNKNKNKKVDGWTKCRWTRVMINHHKSSAHTIFPSAVSRAKAATPSLLSVFGYYLSSTNIPCPRHFFHRHRLWKTAQRCTEPWLHFSRKIIGVLAAEEYDMRNNGEISALGRYIVSFVMKQRIKEFLYFTSVQPADCLRRWAKFLDNRAERVASKARSETA